MILSQRTFNADLRLYHTQDGAVSFDDLCQFNSDELVTSAFELQSRLQSLQLSDEENCVLAAFTVMSTGTTPSFSVFVAIDACHQ